MFTKMNYSFNYTQMNQCLHSLIQYTKSQSTYGLKTFAAFPPFLAGVFLTCGGLRALGSGNFLPEISHSIFHRFSPRHLCLPLVWRNPSTSDVSCNKSSKIHLNISLLYFRFFGYFRKYYSFYSVNAYHKHTNTIQSLLVHSKRHISWWQWQQKCGVIYEINCEDTYSWDL